MTSNSIPDKTIIAIATNGVVSVVDGVPEIDASREAVVHMEDSGLSCTEMQDVPNSCGFFASLLTTDGAV